MSKPVKPIIPYFGGKSYKVRQIKAHFPRDFDAYYEPFFGGGSIGLSVDTGVRRHFNDNNPQLMNLYAQVQQNAEELIELIEVLMRDQSKHAFNHMLNTVFDDPMTEAARFFYVVTCSYGGDTSEAIHYGNRTCSKGDLFREAKRDKIRAASEVLWGARLTCLDYARVAPSEGLVFCDPPYVDASMNYMTSWDKASDHVRLAEQVDIWAQDGLHVLLTYDDHPLIRSLYGRYNIYEYEYWKHTGTSNKTRGRELYITNY